MLRRRKRKTLVLFLRMTFLFFAGLAVAGGVALSQLDVNALKSDIVRTLESETGMPVEINGALSWKFSLRSQVVLKDVRVRNKPWAKHKYGIQIPELHVQINLPSLFRSSPVIQSARMVRPVVNIEENARGELSLGVKKREIRIPQAIRKSEFPFPLDFGIGSVELDRPEIFFIAPEGVDSFTPEMVKASLESAADTMDIAGEVRDGGGRYPFIISFSKFNAEKRTYPVKLTVAGDVMQVVLNMTLGADKIPSDLAMNGTMRRLPVLGKGLGLDLPELARTNVSLSAAFSKKTVTVRNLSVKSRLSNLTVSGKYNFAGKLPKIDVKAKSDNFDLREFFPGLYDGGGYGWVRPNRPLNVFKDIPLFGGILSKIEADAAVEIRNLGIYRDLSIQDISVGIGIHGGEGTVAAKSKFAGGAVNARAVVRDIGDGVLFARAAGNGESIAVGEIMSSVGETDFISGLPSDFDFYLQAKGKELAEIIRTATGPVRIVSATGYAHEDLIEFLYGKDFLTSLRDSVQDAFTGRNRKSRMRISCAVANLKFRNGRTELDRNVAVETRAVNIRAFGDVDFGKERLNIALDTVPVDGIKLSLSGNIINSVGFSGNLAEPDIGINRDAVMGKLATATATGLAVGALTGGVGLLVGAGVGLVGGDVLGNWAADPSPCRTALGAGAPPARRGDPAFLGQPVGDLAAEFLEPGENP